MTERGAPESHPRIRSFEAGTGSRLDSLRGTDADSPKAELASPVRLSL